MIYAQIKSGNKMHLAYQPGEGWVDMIVKAGYLSAPLCGQPVPSSGYRMTCNLPLGHACKACRRVARSREAKGGEE